jgi:hypothetical protein
MLGLTVEHARVSPPQPEKENTGDDASTGVDASSPITGERVSQVGHPDSHSKVFTDGG